MSSADYWRKREADNLANNLKDEKAYKKELDRIYKDMLDACQKEIDSFYGRYAEKEGITIAEAKKRVSKLDIEAYERKAEKYVKEKNFSKQANEEMLLYNLTMKVNRLEMLKANIGLELIAGHEELNTFMEKILNGRTEDELKRQAGILGKSVRDNAKLATAIVNGDFHNASFSQRLWGNQAEMKADLSKMLERGILQGKNARTLTKELRKYFIGDGKKVGKNYAAERLMVTELARVQTEAQKQSFIANGFDEYTFIVNGGCCDICAAIAGKNFKVDKMMPGENAPPMHPWCRCSIAAYEDSDDYEAWLDYLDKGGTTAEWASMKSKLNKSVTVDGNFVMTQEIPADIKDGILSSVNRLVEKYGVDVEFIEYEPYKDNPKAPFTWIPYEKDGKMHAKLNVNSLFNWNNNLKEFNERIYEKNYLPKTLASKNMDDLIFHEYIHFMTFAKCKTMRSFYKEESRVRKLFVPGISRYADAYEDGAESIAEAAVRMRNGEEVDIKTQILVENLLEYGIIYPRRIRRKPLGKKGKK